MSTQTVGDSTAKKSTASALNTEHEQTRFQVAAQVGYSQHPNPLGCRQTMASISNFSSVVCLKNLLLFGNVVAFYTLGIWSVSVIW